VQFKVLESHTGEADDISQDDEFRHGRITRERARQLRSSASSVRILKFSHCLNSNLVPAESCWIPHTLQ
jgi:hypothetical protein